MPASSGDPITSALTYSLAANTSFSSDGESLDSKLVGSAKRVLLTEIQYEKTSSYNNCISELKSKYIVLKPNTNLENGESKLNNGLGFTEVKDLQIASKIPSPPLTSKGALSSTSLNSCSKSNAVLPSPKRVLFDPENIQLGWPSKSFPVGSGMVNLGNTCYLNSTLQALFHVPAFVNWLLNDKAHKDKCEAMNGLTHTECLICAMLKTLRISMENSASSNPIRPHLVYNKLKLICKRLIHGHQEDAHEFLRYLIESMDRFYLRIMQANNLDSYSKETTPLSQIFGGYLRTEVRCLECRNISVTFQHFQDLLLDIRQATTLEEALEVYFSRERLGEGEEAYKCEKCHRRVAATKQFTIEKPPNVLCIQLKRFGIMGGKNSKHVQVQQSLDLTKFWVHQQSQPPNKLSYRLVSLVSHIGPSSNCGHYTAIGLTSSGQFYLFDDSVVRPVASHAVSGNNTYIIMYELTSLKPSLNSTRRKPVNCTVTRTNQLSSSNSNATSDNTTSQISKGPSSSPLPLPNCNGKQSPLTSMALKPLSISSSKPVYSGSPPCTKNGISQPSGKSLVPYSAESSDSESEPTTSKQKTISLTPVKNGLAKESSSSVKYSNCSIGHLPCKTNTSSSLSCKSESISDIPVVVNGWHVTEVAQRNPSGTNYSPPLNWNVIDTSKTKFSSKSEDSSQSKEVVIHNGVNGKEPHGKPLENSQNPSSSLHEVSRKLTNGTFENGIIPYGKNWDGNSNSNTVEYLRRNPHQGYGGNVTMWNGGRTQVDREAENDRIQQRKRSYEQMHEDELDQGKVKKIKNSFFPKNGGKEVNGRRNVFQEHQNHKNNGWNRHHYYRTYNNNYHYKKYQNNNRNSNCHWRR